MKLTGTYEPTRGFSGVSDTFPDVEVGTGGAINVGGCAPTWNLVYL